MPTSFENLCQGRCNALDRHLKIFISHEVANIRNPKSEDAKLIIRVLTFQVTQHIWLQHINAIDGNLRASCAAKIALTKKTRNKNRRKNSQARCQSDGVPKQSTTKIVETISFKLNPEIKE